MRRALVHHLLIVAAAGVICFTTLGGPRLWDEDEPLYASCAWEMLERDDWVVPYYNGQMFPDKPPLMFWMMISGFEIFGRTEFAVRVWSAVLGVATSLLTYHIGRRLFNAGVGLWAGLIVCSCFIFTVSARAATVDSALTFVTTLAVLLFVVGGIAKRRATEGSAGDEERSSSNRAKPKPASRSAAATRRPWFLPQSWWTYVLIWASMGVAVLAKGPIGLLLPMASIGLFVMIMNHRERVARVAEVSGPKCEGSSGGNGRGRAAVWKARLAGLLRCVRPVNFFRSLWQLRPVTGIVVVLLVAGPWFVLVAIRDPNWMHEFLAKYNWRPFTEPILGHSGPIWYYIPAIMIGFFPWSIFMWPTLVEWFRRVRDPKSNQPGHILIVCWLGVFFVFWSICRTKLPHYPLPAYPALALMTAWFAHRWIAQPANFNRWCIRIGLGIVIVVGIAGGVGFAVAASIFTPGEELLGLIGLILTVGGIACLVLAERGRPQTAMATFAVTCVVFITSIFGFAALRIDRYQFGEDVVSDIRDDSPSEPDLAGFRFIRESVVYYAAKPVSYYDDPRQVGEFLDLAEHPYVITIDEHEQALREHYPGQLREVARRPRFLRPGEVVVFAPQEGSHVPKTARRMSPEIRK